MLVKHLIFNLFFFEIVLKPRKEAKVWWDKLTCQELLVLNKIMTLGLCQLCTDWPHQRVDKVKTLPLIMGTLQRANFFTKNNQRKAKDQELETSTPQAEVAQESKLAHILQTRTLLLTWIKIIWKDLTRSFHKDQDHKLDLYTRRQDLKLDPELVVKVFCQEPKSNKKRWIFIKPLKN